MERRHLSENERYRAIGMLQAGSSQRTVAREIGTSQSVVSRLWTRYNATNEVRERHEGAQRKTTNVQDRFLLLRARRNPDITAVQLKQELSQTHNIQVSAQTVRNRLQQQGLFQRRPIRVPRLLPGNRGARLTWAENHVNWDQQEWGRVLFSDESRFSYHPDSRRIRIWREPGKAARLQHAREIVKYGGGSIMFWGAIHIGGRTDLILIEGNLNAIKYRDEIVLPIVIPYLANIGQNAMFQQDNARPHTARVIRNIFEEHGTHVLQWPANSPDMSPIEKIWDVMKRQLVNHREGFANQQELERAVQRIWANLDQEMIDGLILAMSRRCRAVINQRGGPSGY